MAVITKSSTKCYRFSTVDFEPGKCRLVWQDKTVTDLTNEESQWLALLCHHAGEVLSSFVLLNATKPAGPCFNPHYNNLCSLLAKSYKSGQKALPIEAVGDYGFRIAIPKETVEKQETKESRDLSLPSKEHGALRVQTPHPPFDKSQINRFYGYKIALLSLAIISLFTGLYYCI